MGNLVPTAIEQAGPDTLLVRWSDGVEHRFPVRRLRLACPCAGCLNEVTGERVLREEAVPEDVHPVRVRSVGNYAIQISWSDGHDTGIYSWKYLRRLGESL